MVGTSKILTVSYGTFSCTLEGFDDSFGTMKAIAEYFRDLASDDRYFGAEPPQPDAEMLARIAEREIARRVEARSENGAFHLRAAALAAPDADPDGAANVADPVSTAPAAVAETAEVSQPTASDAPTATDIPADQDGIDAGHNDALADDDASASIPAAAAAPAPVTPQAAPAETAMPVSDAVSTTVADLDVAPSAPAPDTHSSVAALMADQIPASSSDAPAAAPETVAPVPTDAATAAPDAPSEDDSVAAKLRRIRAVVGNGAPAAAAAQFTEDEHADDFMGETARDIDDILRTDVDMDEDTGDAGSAADALSVFDDDAADDTDQPVSDIWDETPGPSDAPEASAPAATDAVADVAPSVEADDSDDADELDDFAAPADQVAQSRADAVAAPADTSAEPAADETTASDMPPGRVRVLRMKRAEFEAAVAAGEIEEDTGDALPATSLSPEDEADLQRELAAVEAELAGDADDAPLAAMDAPEAEEAVDAPEFADGDDIYDDDTSDPAPRAEADPDAYDFDEDESDVALAQLAASRARVAVDDADDWDDAEDTAEADTPQPQAAPVAHDDDLYDDQYDDLEEDEADDWDDAPHAPHSDRLTPVDEEALDRNLAAIMADGDMPADGDYEDDADDAKSAGLAASIRQMARRTVKMGSEARERLTARAPEDDAEDVDRLMDQAKGRLDEPQGQTRRNAIQHLRAAVAATKAEKEASPADAGDEDDTEAYRGDLAEVVRPRRPSSGGQTARPERPRATARPAPLKLVAEQRVDLPRDEPVRPRRVAQDLAANLAETDGFADFAENVGAHTLPELLEAAAAYMSFVEGRDEFSRPQLMTAVRAVSENAFSREDGLRYFGQLLRDGKIERLEGGRFMASDDNDYAPEDRAVG